MSNKMNKPQGNGSKMISKLANKMNPAIKRPLQTSSPSGPAAKKLNTALNSPFSHRKVGGGSEDAPKEKKEPKPIFEIFSAWKEGVENIKGNEFDGIARTVASTTGDDKAKRIQGFALGVVKGYIETERSDSEVLQKLAAFVKEQKQYLVSIHVVHALFELLPAIEAKEFIPAIASSLSSIITQLKPYPVQLLKLVINDSCLRRLWTDQADSVQLYYSIISVFGGFTIPSTELYQQAEIPWAKKSEYDSATFPCLFNLNSEVLQAVIEEAVTKISQRCTEDGNKSLIRTILFMIRNKQIQRAAIKKLDAWLQNVKLQRSAMDLLLVFACNITEVESSDIREFLNDLILMQAFRSKQHIIVLQVAIDVLCRRFPSIMDTFIASILEAEFSPKLKLTHTYTLMHHLCSLNPTEASSKMAARFVQIIHQQKTFKQVRAFLREFTKTAFRGNDFAFDEFARCIFEGVKQRVLFSEDFSTTELFKNVVNLCAVLPLSAVVSNIKESGNLRRSGNALTSSQSEVLTRYHGQLRHFMTISIEFLKWAASANLCENVQSYVEAYHQLLYLGFYKSYSTVGDGWPSEVEYNSVIRIVHECVIDDSVLLPLVTPTVPSQVGPEKILDILELITQRALALAPIPSNHSFVNIRSIKVIEKLLELSIVDHGDAGGRKIANRKMYQHAWFLLYKWVILSKNEIFKEVYENYPLLKMMMHMTIINNFNFPIPMFNGKTSREIATINQVEEKTEHQTITATQLLRPIKTESVTTPSSDPFHEFCLSNPTGPPRNFPELFVALHHFAKDTIALYLCGIRSPDILGSLAQDKLGDLAMPMIQEAITKHPSIVENLPLQTLAQLFFYDLLNVDERRKVDSGFIRSKLKRALDDDGDAAKEIITFFLSKLCSNSSEDRHSVLKSIQSLIGDNSTAEHPINALSKIPLFKSISDQICRDLSYSVTIENDLKLIMDNISFIAKHMESGDIHLIALRLTKVIERVGGSSEEHKEVQDALLDFFASYLKSILSNVTVNLPEIDDANDEILRIKIPQYCGEFNLSSKVLTGMLTLLCETPVNMGESNINRELLLNTWFVNNTNQKPRVCKISDGTEVNLLPDRLKSKMLASSDDRIINAALFGMTVERALGFLQSSAITTSAYSKLLALVNANKPPKGNLRSIAIFVRAYKLKGAQGADEFLNYVNEVEGSSSNEQMHPNQNMLVLDPPPTLGHLLPTNKALQAKQYSFDSSQIVIEYLKNVLQKTSKMMDIFTDPNWFKFTKALKRKEFAITVADYLKQNKSKISVEFLRIIILMFLDGYRVDKVSFDPILSKLAIIFNDIPQIAGLLTGFVKKDVEMSNPDEYNIKKLSANEILEILIKTTRDTPQTEISRLLLRYRDLCPEIIESNLSPLEFKKKIYTIFSANVPPIAKLIADLGTSEYFQTTKKVLQFVLESYESSIAPALVINFVDKCIKVPDSYLQLVPTPHQTIILIDYVIADMSSNNQTSKSFIPEFLDVLQALYSKHGMKALQQILQNISERIEISLKPPMDEPHLVVLNRLVDELGKVFYGSREVVEQFQKASNTFTAIKSTPKSVVSANLDAYFALIEIVDATETSEQSRIDAALENLKKLSRSVPKVVAGHMQVMTDRIVPILAQSAKKHRDNNFIRLLEVPLETVLATAPHSYENDRSLNLLLRPYLEFFYGRVTYSTRFEKLFILLVDCCLGYIIRNPKHGRSFLKNESNFFRAMQNCYNIESVAVLVRQIEDLVLVK